ncbi:MAG: hypothetical protein QOK49_3970, partial [Baekduia sp.]|nr:hypothetical protein [Baekduia sp.]
MAVEAAAIQVTLPAMGESVTEGTILEWHKQEGDTIEADEILVEVSTDKVDAEVPSPASGTIVKIHAAEGDTVQVGSVLADIAVGAGDGGSPNGHGGNGSDPSAPEAPAEAEAPGEIVDITTPAGGESVTEGTILEWAVKVGDHVDDGDTIVEISTDKVDMELPAPAAGTITELLAQEGDTVVVGQVIARMQLGSGAAAPEVEAPADGQGAATGNGGAPAAAPADANATPVAARVAAAEGVNLAGVTGTGPQGRITKDDVLDAKGNGGVTAAAGPSTDGATATGARTVLKGGAAMLARYMDESREIPTATSFRTITVTAMDARRKQLKEAGQKVSFTHLIAYAISLGAQQDMPVMSHHFDTVDGKPTRIDDGAVNLGLAVDVEKKDGSRTLRVPVIRDAGRKPFKEFKAAFDELIDNARTNSLTADDLTGANISLTNPGGIGTIVATGSIAYPVGLGTIGDMIGAEKVMTMTSTYDHRVIQG